MAGEVSFLSDAIVWYALSVVIVLGLIVKFGTKPFVGFLDGEIAKIKEELEEARRLRKEAEAFLASATTKQIASITEANEIVAHARSEADRLRREAETDLRDRLVKLEQRAVERIAQAETEALADVRRQTIVLAVSAARQTLSEKLDPATAATLVEEAITEVPRLAGNGKI